MGKIYDKQDFLTIEVVYYDENDAAEGIEDISTDIDTGKLKYRFEEVEGEWPATINTTTKTFSYSLPQGTFLTEGRYEVWPEATMNDGRVIQGTVFRFTVHPEGT